MNEWLYSLSAEAIVAVLFLFFVATWQIGLSVGLRLSQRSEARAGDSQGLAIEAAILTLFGLLLGFTFSMAASRYESRKETGLEESNAIGTAYLRADFLPANEKKMLQQSLRNYLDSRVEFYQAPFNADALKGANEKSDRFQREAWNLAVEEGKVRPTPISSLLLAALNQMIDLREKQQVGFENRVPQAILLFLFVLSLLVVGVIGYMNGIHGARRLPLSLLFCVVVSMTLFLVLDLDRPRRGLILVGHESLLRLRSSLPAP